MDSKWKLNLRPQAEFTKAKPTGVITQSQTSSVCGLVMTLRTPRRRISPRTKRRYRAIREFFRRALGSSSQPDIKISSSIAVNVTDLKRKIVGLEQQLDEVNRHCQDIACLECSTRETESYIQSEKNNEIETIKEKTEGSSERKFNGIETKLIYKSSECNYGKSGEGDYRQKPHDGIDHTQDLIDEYEEHVSKVKNKKSKLNRITDYGAKLHKHRARSVYENLYPVYSTSSFRSLINPRINHLNAGYSGHPAEKKHSKQEYTDPVPSHPHKDKKHKEHHTKRNKIDHYREMYEQQKPNRIYKHKHHHRELDQDFIADIIRRQYKPMKMFGKKESELSQFSAPVCRDQEFSIRNDIQEGTELCSCCYDGHKHKPRHSDVSEMRSICDTRLYSSKKQTRGKQRRMHMDSFNNSDLYDLIPVKENSSPKSRRKFTEDNKIPYEYYREVPPSPRTLRPRLNLKAQYSHTEFEDYMAHVKHSRKKGSPHRQKRHRERVESESDTILEPVPNLIVEQPRKTHKHMTCQVETQEPCQQETGTMSSLQYPPYVNEQANATVDTTFNKTQEAEITDKTDKALCEIKDILQSFLHEIKKETIASQCDKSDTTSKTGDNRPNVINENSANLYSNVMPNSHNFNNYSGQCPAPPYMAPFTNPCCYPIMCPMNYPMSMQNGFMLPSQSYTCTNCANVAKESSHNEHCCSKNINTTETGHTETCHTETCHTETEELIKEIYKFVAQGPAREKDHEGSINRRGPKNVDAKILTSRSVGESSRLSKHDAQVGTPPLKCYSKSCEAIGSRVSSEPYSSGTNPSYSDTVLEKLSLEVSQSTSITEETETTEEKSRGNKFSKAFRSIGLFKKKKKDVIEELSESESAIDVEIKAKSPYAQEVTNYMMHGQEYYQPPPMPQNYHRPHEYQPDYHPAYNPGMPEYPPPQPMYEMYPQRAQNSRMREHATAPGYHSKQQATAPPYHHSSYENQFNQMRQPQVPLCLKEIEVKSIGTQSERKVSIFRKIKKKIQPPETPDDDYNQKTCSTQTQVTQKKPAVTKPLFNWKNLQAKAMMDRDKMNTDPMNFSLKAQKELAIGDQKIRNAMLKKMFYKRNPFSPRNLIVRTLLGKDKSTFGEPTRYKPRMFF